MSAAESGNKTVLPTSSSSDESECGKALVLSAMAAAALFALAGYFTYQSLPVIFDNGSDQLREYTGMDGG